MDCWLEPVLLEAKEEMKKYTADQVEAGIKRLLRMGLIEVFMQDGVEHFRLNRKRSIESNVSKVTQ